MRAAINIIPMAIWFDSILELLSTELLGCKISRENNIYNFEGYIFIS